MVDSELLAKSWEFGLLCRRKNQHPNAIDNFRMCLSLTAFPPPPPGEAASEAASTPPWAKEFQCRFNLGASLADSHQPSLAIAEFLALLQVADQRHSLGLEQALASIGGDLRPSSSHSVAADCLIAHLPLPPLPSLPDTLSRFLSLCSSLPAPLPAILQSSLSSLSTLLLTHSLSPPRALSALSLSLHLQPPGKAERGDYYNLNLLLRQLGHQDLAVEATTALLNERGLPVRRLSPPPPSPVNSPLNVCCVKYGTKYGPDYVNNLYQGVLKHTPDTPFIFHCFTDDPSSLHPSIEIHALPKPLSRTAAGWWHKALLFSHPALSSSSSASFSSAPSPSRCLYIDLDSVITGPLQPLLDAAEFVPFATLGTENMMNERRGGGLNTSVMAWHSCPELAAVQTLLDAGFGKVERFIYKLDHWFELLLGDCPRLQSLADGPFVLEYKEMREKHGLAGGGLEGVAIVTFPLEPKPHQCEGEEWMRGRWTAGAGVVQAEEEVD